MSADKYDGGYCLYIPWLEISQKNKRIKSLLLTRKVLLVINAIFLATICPSPFRYSRFELVYDSVGGIPVLLTVNIHLSGNNILCLFT